MLPEDLPRFFNFLLISHFPIFVDIRVFSRMFPLLSSLCYTQSSSDLRHVVFRMCCMLQLMIRKKLSVIYFFPFSLYFLLCNMSEAHEGIFIRTCHYSRYISGSGYPIKSKSFLCSVFFSFLRSNLWQNHEHLRA
jgi:hypothetical protein